MTRQAAPHVSAKSSHDVADVKMSTPARLDRDAELLSLFPCYLLYNKLSACGGGRCDQPFLAFLCRFRILSFHPADSAGYESIVPGWPASEPGERCPIGMSALSRLFWVRHVIASEA